MVAAAPKSVVCRRLPCPKSWAGVGRCRSHPGSGTALGFLAPPSGQSRASSSRAWTCSRLAGFVESARRGVGTLLIGAVYTELRRLGVQQLGLSVLSTSRDAIRFYERLGLLPYCVSYLGNIPPAPA